MGRFRIGRIRLHAISLKNGENFRLGQVEAQGFHSDFKLMVIDAIVLVKIKQAKLKAGINSMPRSKPIATPVTLPVL